MADYQIIPYGSTAFAVKVTFPSGHARTERGFLTEADAKAWIEGERAREADRIPPPDRPA